jgi:Erv1 / Alr family
LSSTEDNSKWKELENQIEAEGFKRVAYEKNALGGSGEISEMSFRRDNLYINVKREKDEKGNLTDKFDVELYNSDTGATEEQNGLSQNMAWNMAKVAAEAGTSFGERTSIIPDRIHVQVSTNTPNIKKSFFEYMTDPNDKEFGIFVRDFEREKKEPGKAFNLLLFPVASMSFDEADRFLNQGEYKIPENSPFEDYRGKTFYRNYPIDVGLPSYWDEIKDRVRELQVEKEQTTLGELKAVHTGYAPVTKQKETVPEPEFFPSTLDFFLRPKEQKKLDEGSEGEAHEFELYRPFMNTKEIVGRSTWTLLHSIAAGVHDPPTSDEQSRITTIIRELSGTYPCVECRPGFSYVEQTPPDFSSRASFERWLCSWHNAVSRHIGKNEIICDSSKLHQAYQLGCEACKRVKTMEDQTALILEAERDHTPLTKPESQRVVDIVVSELCGRYGVPKPKILFEENVQFCPGTSCTIQDAKHPIETTHIYYNPSAFSLRTTAHEFYHYLASVLKPEEIKRKLGFSFQGDPDDEREADAFAFKVIDEIYSPTKVRLNRDSGIGSNGMPQQQQELETIKVMKQELTFMGGGVNAPIFEKLSALYTMFEPYANLRAEDLNNIYSPEIFGTVFDVGYNVLLTPLGAVLSNVVSWLVLAALGSQRNLAYTDRYFLSEWAAYHGTRILRLADPAYLSSTTGSARAIGRAVGSGRAQDALNQVVKNQNEIAGGFRAALNAVQEAFGAINLPKIPQINLGGITGSSSGSAQVTNVDGHGSGFN